DGVAVVALLARLDDAVAAATLAVGVGRAAARDARPVGRALRRAVRVQRRARRIADAVGAAVVDARAVGIDRRHAGLRAHAVGGAGAVGAVGVAERAVDVARLGAHAVGAARVGAGERVDGRLQERRDLGRVGAANVAVEQTGRVARRGHAGVALDPA